MDGFLGSCLGCILIFEDFISDAASIAVTIKDIAGFNHDKLGFRSDLPVNFIMNVVLTGLALHVVWTVF